MYNNIFLFDITTVEIKSVVCLIAYPLSKMSISQTYMHTHIHLLECETEINMNLMSWNELNQMNVVGVFWQNLSNSWEQNIHTLMRKECVCQIVESQWEKNRNRSLIIVIQTDSFCKKYEHFFRMYCNIDHYHCIVSFFDLSVRLWNKRHAEILESEVKAKSNICCVDGGPP